MAAVGANTIPNLPNVSGSPQTIPAPLWNLEVRRTAEPLFIFRQFATDVRSTWGDSTTINVLKRNNVTTGGAALTAGTQIPRDTYTTATVAFTPSEYGNAISPEARQITLSPFGLTAEMRDLLARDAARTLDTAIRTTLMASVLEGTNCFTMGGGGTTVGTTKPSGTGVGSATYRLTEYGVWAAVDYLSAQNAPKINKGPGEGYVGILHPYQARGIKRTAEFISAVEYTTNGPAAFNNEIGFWEGVYWVESTQGFSGSYGSTHYCAILLGADAFGEYAVNDVEIRRDPDTDFGRQQHWAWYGDMGWSVVWADRIAGIYSLTGSP